MMEHMMYHHKQEYGAVVLANSVRQQPRVIALLEGSGSIAEMSEQMSNPGNPEGVVFHPVFMSRYAALAGSFQSRSCAEKVTDTFTASQSSQSSHHLGCKKVSKKVPPPLTAPVSSEVVFDVLDLTKKVSPNYSLLPTTRPVQHSNVLLTMRR